MNASSRLAERGDSSCTRSPCSAARSPIGAAPRPMTVKVVAAAGANVTSPPARSSSSARRAASGEMTRTWLPAPRRRNSVIVVSAISRPRPMTMTWSAVSSISFMRWLDTKTVRPSSASLRISVRIQRMPSGSRPLTGSSKSSVAGSPSRAAAMPSRWRHAEREAADAAGRPRRSGRPRRAPPRPARRDAAGLRRASAGAGGRCGCRARPWRRAARRPRASAPASSR